MKCCTKCGVEKPETEFHKCAKHKDGLCYRCKECANNKAHNWAKENPEQHRESGRQWRSKNREKVNAANARWAKKYPEKAIAKERRRQYRRKYDLTVLQYDALLLVQKGVCAICKETCKSKQRLSVDHIHGINPPIIRGLLCGRCNISLGGFRDSPELLLAAASYLQQPKQISTPRVDSIGYMSPC